MKLKALKRSALVATLLASFVAGPVTSFAQPAGVDASVEQKLSIATQGELATLDSALYNDVSSSDMIGQVFEGLYRVKNGTEVEFGQAESVKVSDDGLTYTFTLRDGLKWSDGSPVTAADFEYSYQRLADPKSGASVQSVDVFKNAAAVRKGEKEVSELGVKALDDKTLEVTLEYPAPYLPKLLSGSRYMPVSKAVHSAKADKYGTSADNVVTNGPFTIQDWNGTNLEWKLVKNDNYWDAANVYLKDVQVQVIKENSTGADLFDAGQLDYTTLTDQFVQEYTGADDFHTASKATIGYLSFNTQREATANADLRRAIAQAFDKQVYADSVIQDGSKVLNNQVPKDFDVNEAGEDYQTAAGPMLEYNLEAAQADWAKAKAALGKDTIELQLLTSDVGLSKRTAEFLQAQLEANLPGLKLTISSVPLKNRLEFQRQSDFDIFYGTWAPDYQDALNFIEQYKTGGGINFAKYSNAEYDKLVEQARNEYANDPAKRRQALIQAETIGIKQDAVAAPIYQSATSYLLKARVKNFEVMPFGRTINLRPVYVTE
ncbi:peptide ABC transporter substrate-binding protein [Abiotrophia sp. HMSC24B09]|uniref:peptide ABC transporter substrate-binding protein n=1 Tax=Abiotrophia sp. HMSC24B09 TaxID=1581061 RepID=UPI0008A21F4E|nr:peptide ABC transporter substrate-binding protein [Abiotrophia sp. HMSC24B09]OFS29261.1 peptide ABC transporter substrate-binding protein [Abiotrophia sp. HMSC24B09]